jgi:transcriptional regulator GlxA family with amidase domain
MRTSARSVSLVLFDEVELFDVACLLQVLSAAGRQWNFRPFKVTAVAETPGLVDTRAQLRVEAKRPFSEVTTSEIVLVPGGYGARRALANAALTGWLAEVGAGAERVIAVGNGILLLAKAGLLANQDVAAPSEIADLLAELEPAARLDRSAEFRASGNVLTAATSLAAVDVALALVESVLGKKQADGVARALGKKVEPPSTGVRIVESE